MTSERREKGDGQREGDEGRTRKGDGRMPSRRDMLKLFGTAASFMLVNSFGSLASGDTQHDPTCAQEIQGSEADVPVYTEDVSCGTTDTSTGHVIGDDDCGLWTDYVVGQKHSDLDCAMQVDPNFIGPLPPTHTDDDCGQPAMLGFWSDAYCDIAQPGGEPPYVDLDCGKMTAAIGGTWNDGDCSWSGADSAPWCNGHFFF